MADSPSLRRLVVDRVLSALESINAKIPISVNLEADGTLIVRASLGGVQEIAQRRSSAQSEGQAAAATATKVRRGRPPKAREGAATPAPAPTAPSGRYADRVLAVLNEPENQTGLNLVNLAAALGMRRTSKMKLKPDVDALVKSGRLKMVGSLFRRTDVTVKRGAKPKGKTTLPARLAAKKPKRRGPGRPPGKQKRPATPAQLAALKKAQAVRAAKKATRGAIGKKAAKIKATIKPTKKKPAKRRTAPAKAKAAKKATKPRKAARGSRRAVRELLESTDESGQFPREGTRREAEGEEGRTE